MTKKSSQKKKKKPKSRTAECPKCTNKVSERARMYETENWSKKFKDAALMYSSLKLSPPNLKERKKEGKEKKKKRHLRQSLHPWISTDV